MRKKILFSLLLICALTLQAQETLSYTLNTGDEFTILQEVEQTTTLSVAGQEQVINNDIQATFLFKVIETLPSSYKIEMSFQNFGMDMKMAGQTMMSIDTQANDGNPANAMFVAMLNKPVILVMETTGKITEVTNGEAIVNAMMESMPEMDAITKATTRAQLAKEYSGETLAASFEQMTFYYPQEKKSISDTWENSYRGEGKVNAKNIWTYVSEQENERILTATADITMNIDSGQMTMTLAGTQESTATIDPASGFLKTLEVKSTAAGNSEMPQMPGTQMPTTLITNTKYTQQ